MGIFITGGTGYIGSHCAALFSEQGHEVTLYDNLHNSERDVVNNDGVVECNGKIRNLKHDS